FILAGGPSIGSQDLRPLRNEVCISTSNFFVHQDFDWIRPEYHCVPTFSSPPHPEAAAVEWFTKMHAAIGRAALVTDCGNQRVIQNHQLFQGRRIYYMRTGASWDQPLPATVDLTRKVPPAQSVPVTALFLALYLGFGQIYLMGCDHSWLDHFGESRHFYPE